ncbi:hypothetical protein ACWEO1_19080 [Kitasatospora cineracea]
MRSSARRPGRFYRRCGCRDADRRQLGAGCPRLADDRHGTWTFAVDIPSFDGRRPGFGTDPHETVAAYLTK